MVPASMRLCVAPAEAGELYESKVDTWRRVVHEVNLEPGRDLAVNTLHPARLTAQHLLAAPTPICEVDFAHATGLHLAGRVRVTAVRAGMLHGICGGIVTTLSDRIEISNLPGDQGTSNFAFLPIETPVTVSAGDGIEIQVDSYDGEELRWIVAVTAAESGATRRFTQATFLSRTLSRESLRKRDPHYRPSLGARSRMERDLLAQIDGTRTVGEIEQWLLAHGAPTLTPRSLAELLASTIERCD
jgi:hypothetical protein